MAVNSNYPGGVSKLSRSQVYKKKALWKKQKGKQTAGKATIAATVSKTIGGDKNGKTRVVEVTKSPRFYETTDAPKACPANKNARPAKVRASIKPGAVLILLSGRFRGKRVVCLKTLPSGLAVVTGPFAINGVPMKRVDPAYVIATSTSVDVSKVDTSVATDDFFARPASAGNKPSGEFFEGKDGVSRVVRPLSHFLLWCSDLGYDDLKFIFFPHFIDREDPIVVHRCTTLLILSQIVQSDPDQHPPEPFQLDVS